MLTWSKLSRKLHAWLGPRQAEAGGWNPMNPYGTQLSSADIARGLHRDAVGGRWDEMGLWQFAFLREQGLRPQDRLLDVGCGSLRGGCHFIRYLEPGHYYGIDCNASILEGGGRIELARAGLEQRWPHLLVNGAFEFHRFAATFRYALALSVFTHLSVNAIERCLVRIAEVLEPGGRFFATYFDAPAVHQLVPLPRPDGIQTQIDADPYHYHFSVFRFLVNELPLTVESLGTCGHPRQQTMLVFTRT